MLCLALQGVKRYASNTQLDFYWVYLFDIYNLQSTVVFSFCEVTRQVDITKYE